MTVHSKKFESDEGSSTKVVIYLLYTTFDITFLAGLLFFTVSSYDLYLRAGNQQTQS